jgi:hypothetical protein
MGMHASSKTKLQPITGENSVYVIFSQFRVVGLYPYAAFDPTSFILVVLPALTHTYHVTNVMCAHGGQLYAHDLVLT